MSRKKILSPLAKRHTHHRALALPKIKILVTDFRPDVGTREIRVILYAKDDPFCAPAPANELSIEDILAVEHDIIPLNGADVFQQGEINSIGDRVALT